VVKHIVLGKLRVTLCDVFRCLPIGWQSGHAVIWVLVCHRGHCDYL
jgi:hypothetical protein